MAEQLWFAVRHGDAEAVERVLKENPGLDVNLTDSDQWTLLAKACAHGHAKVVALLLKQPGINVNKKNDATGFTPFMAACYVGETGCIRMMLGDMRSLFLLLFLSASAFEFLFSSRVNLNEPDNTGYTPLFFSARDGDLDIIKWWIASGREMDLGQPGNEKNDAIGAARANEKTVIVSLLEGVRDHPEETRLAVRSELSWYDEGAAGRFAVIIFLCDELLALMKMTKKEDEKTVRFLKMVSKLPMEMQMKVSHMAAGSARENISGKAREEAFKQLAKKLEK